MAVQTKKLQYFQDLGQVIGRLLRRRSPVTAVIKWAYTITSGTKFYPVLIPSGARLIDLWVDVEVADNSGTSAVIDVGSKLVTTGTEDVDGYIDNQDIKSAAKVRFEIATGAAPYVVGQPFTEDTLIVVTITQDGTAASAGNGRIVVKYILDDADTVDAADYAA